jgi:glycosyltransferase involved in cell wall biosynthesis
MSKLTFSVVIPTCGRQDRLARCLESLRPGTQLAGSDSYEVIVTDDARGQTVEAMMHAQFPWAKWVQGPSRGPAANRNNGARHARGEWVCFIDDDCVASKEWIAAFLEASSDKSIDVLEGQTTVPDQRDNPFLHGICNTEGGAYWSCNLGIRRERFLALGGFDEDFLEPASEDMEFAHRFKAHHLRGKFYPEAQVFHPAVPVSWSKFLKRQFLVRWSALYCYKVDVGLHLSDSPGTNVLHALKDMILKNLRLSWHDFRYWNGDYWRSRMFRLVIRWVTFPVILPYYLYWVYRFHRQLTANDLSRTPGPA